MSDRVAVLNAGRLEQCATPRELYLRPATAFVAGFVGETNLLPAVVDKGGRAVHVTALGLDIPLVDQSAGAAGASLSPHRCGRRT